MLCENNSMLMHVVAAADKISSDEVEAEEEALMKK